MKIIIFGSGSYANNFMRVLKENIQIPVIADNNPEKWGTKFNGIDIISPNDLKTVRFTYICIASMYTDEISSQLIDLGIDKNKLVSTYSPNSINEKSMNVLEKIIDFSKAKRITFPMENVLSNDITDIIQELPKDIINKLDIKKNQNEKKMFLMCKDEIKQEINIYVY